MAQVLLFSITAMANPTLVAVTSVMLLLPSPKKLMLGYLIGAMAMSITLGIVIVFGERNAGLVAAGKHSINPAIDVALGGILLLIALVLRTGRDEPVRERRRERKERKAKPKAPPRWQRALTSGDWKITILVGAALTLPGASYLAALTHIAKLNYGDTGTVLLVLLVNVIMLALLEVPLICFVLAPDWTPAAIDRAKAWFRRGGRRIAVIGTTTIGSLLILRALITLIA
ncbi:MAG TPA: GAP family protein [Solirubrobacteraceae bacterium]|jgi:hypothetical protein